jgi:hypothetical protein
LLSKYRAQPKSKLHFEQTPNAMSATGKFPRLNSLAPTNLA